MNLARFQISLNHNDPNIVAKGLEEFQRQALWDLTCSADSSCKFGYYGRSCFNELCKSAPDSALQNVLHPVVLEFSDIDGILVKYLAASPEVEELFVIWSLPNRDLHLALSIQHTATFSIIIHCLNCLKSKFDFALQVNVKIANRIISNHYKVILNQLSSSSVELVHSTMGLLFSMCKISANICQAVYLKIISTSLQTFTSAIQSKQTVVYSCINEHAHQTTTVEAQQLMTMILLLIIESCVVENSDESTSILDQILPASNQSHQPAGSGSSKNSLLKKLLQHTVHTESSLIQRFLMLNGLLYLLQYPALDQYLHILFESVFIQKLLDMNRETLSIDDQSNLVQPFFLTLSHQLVQKCSSFKKNGQQSASYNSVHGCATTIVRHLKAEAITEHKQIQGVLVEGIPSLLPKCVSALTISSWQPVPTPQYFSCLSHLSWLVSRAGVDAKTKATLRRMTSRGASDRKVPADELLRAVIPSELTKKDMIKLLSHSNHYLKLLGWSYVSNVLAWLLRVFSEASVSRSGDAESVLIDHGFFRVLPDMAFILSVRSGVLRDVNAQSKDKGKAVESAIAADSVQEKEAVKVDTIDEDFDFNFDGAMEENETAPVKAAVSISVTSPRHEKETSGRNESLTIDAKILRAVHKVIEHYMLLIPTAVLQEKFDVLRLLDEHVKWSQQQTLQEAVDHWKETADRTLTLSILHILKLCGKSHCRWFGTQEETTKILTNIIVTEDWAKSTKRTVLAKLMLLTHCSATIDGTHSAMTEDVASKARSLLRAIVADTQLFLGQSVLDLELGIELDSWLRIATVDSEWGKYSLTSGPTNESALIVDIILHLAYHWNTALCIELSSIASTSARDIQYLWSVWDKKDFSIVFPSIDPSSVEDMLPMSPLLFAAICLLKLELKVFATQLPVYVQNYIADKQAPQSQTFFQKYFSRFFKDLEDVLLDIVYTTWKASRSREKYVGVIERLLLGNDGVESSSTKRTVEQIQKWKQLISDLDPVDTSLTSLSYQQIVQLDRVFNSDNLFPALRKLVSKKSRKNGGDSELLHISSVILFSVSVLNTVDSQIASTGSILGEFMSSNFDIVSLVYLRQKEQSITLQGLEWLRGQISRMGEEADSVLIRQASFLSYALHISNFCCQSFGRIIFHQDDYKTGDVSHVSNDIVVRMKSFVDTVYTVVDKLLSSHITTRSSALFISVLSSSTSNIFDAVFGSNDFTMFSRQLLYRYAQLQLSSSSSKSKTKGKSESSTMLWEALIARFSRDHQCDSSSNVLSGGSGNGTVSLDSLLLLVNKLIRNEFLQAYCAKLVLRYHDIGSGEESIKLLKREIALNADASVLLYEVDPTCQLIVNQFEVKFFPQIVFDKKTKFFDIIPIGGGQVAAPRPGVLLTITNGSVSYYLNPFCLIDMNVELRERFHPIRHLDIELNNIQPSIFSSPYLSVFENCINEVQGHNTGIMETIAVLASTPSPMMNITNFKLSSYELATCLSEDWSYEDVKLSSLQYQAIVHYLSSIEDKLIVKSARILLYILEHQDGKNEAVNFIHNFLSVLIQCSSASNAEMTEYSTMPTFPVLIMLRNLNLEGDSPSIIMEMVLDTISYYLDTLVVFVKKNISSEGDTGDIILYERLLHRVSEFLALEYSSFTEDCSVQLEAARRKLNSAIRYCLKVFFDSPLTHSFIFDTFVQATRKRNTLVYGILQSADGLHSDSLIRPVVMLQMITGHSKFADIISTRKTAYDSRVDAATARRIGLWKLVLIFVSSIVEEKSELEGGESFDSSCTILLDIFQQEYRGTLSLSDRLMLRIIHILYSKGIGGAPCSHTVKNVTASRQAAKTTDSKMEWVIDILSSSMVYSTLAEYSIQRPSYSLPFDFESQIVHSKHRADVNKQLKLLSNVMTPSALKKRHSSDVYSSDEEEYDDDAVYSDKYPAPQQADTLESCTEKSYDPSFFLSALLYMLQRGAVTSNSKSDGDNTLSGEETESTISMRRMASTGGLALVIAGLSSSCSVNRTYALACLHKVWTILKSQTSERDALFKERPQIQLLLNFIRNATAGLRSKSVFRLPPGTAIFLARCSIQLMQPSGELYSEMNRYLLSRPFCDECDVPLLDFVIFNGDVETFITEKVAALRLVRDGLLTVQDHLNLSRKNAYNRLMMMFPIICYDTRAGHAVLDIFDRALRMKISSQYLLEQCDFLQFIGVLLSPTSHAVNQETNSDLSALFGPTSKYLLRLFQLFRRSISVATALARQGEMSITTVLHAQSLILGYQSKLKVLKDNDSSHILRQLPEEYFRLMTLCMWDVAVSLQGFSEQHHNLRLADIDVVTSFISVIEAYESAKMSTSDTDRISDIVAAVVCLLAFKSSYSNGSTSASKSDIKLVINRCYGICMQRLLKRDCIPSYNGTFYAIERFSATQPALPHKNHSFAAVPTTTLLDLDTVSGEVDLSQLLEEEFLVHCCVKLIAQGIAYFGDTDEFDIFALGRLGLVIWTSYFHDTSSLFCRRIRVSSHSIIVAIEGIRSNEELYLLHATNVLSLVRLAYLLAHCISMQSDSMKALNWTIAEPLMTSMAQLTTILRRPPSEDQIFRTLDELCLYSRSSVLAVGVAMTKSLQLCSIVVTALDAATAHRVVETLTMQKRIQYMMAAQSWFLQSLEIGEVDRLSPTGNIWDVAVSEDSFLQFSRQQHVEEREEDAAQGQAGLIVAHRERSKNRKRRVGGSSSGSSGGRRTEKKIKLFRPLHLNHHL